MRGLVPPAASFDAWVRALISLRGRYPDPLAGDIIHAIRHAIAEARAAGTGVIGDISNTLVTARMLHDLGMPAHVFHEVLGFRVTDGTETLAAARRRIDAVGQVEPVVRVSLAPHAPYSVSPALFMSIAGEMQDAITSIHLGESPEEVHFLRHGGGPIQAALESLGAWNPEWTPPRCGPVEYIEKFGLLSERLLAVHGVQLSYRELAQLAAAGATLVTCPRSNRWVGAGSPPVDQFYALGRARRDRHRQPGQRRGSQPVLGNGADSRAGPGHPGPGDCRKRHPHRRRGARIRRATTAPSSRESAPR